MGSVTQAFEAALARTLDREAGYSKDPNDKGNWTGGRVGVGELRGTKYGISAAAYPALNIATLTVDEAEAIYLRDYWSPYRLDDIPVRLAVEVFDAIVNHGPGNAVRWMQKALGVAMDGVVGPQTIGAAQRASDLSAVVMRFHAARLLFITQIASWNFHGKGLVRRVALNMMEAKE